MRRSLSLIEAQFWGICYGPLITGVDTNLAERTCRLAAVPTEDTTLVGAITRKKEMKMSYASMVNVKHASQKQALCQRILKRASWID